MWARACGCAFKRACQIVHVCVPVRACMLVRACGCLYCLSVHECACVCMSHSGMGSRSTGWVGGGGRDSGRAISSLFGHPPNIIFANPPNTPRASKSINLTIP